MVRSARSSRADGGIKPLTLMIDVNIIIDHIGRREQFYELSRLVCLLGLVGDAREYISSNMVTDIHYLLSKDYGSKEAQRMIQENLSFLNIANVSAEDVQQALSMRWDDFEDCLVSVCAKNVGADYIITRNVKDYKRSSVLALTPEQLFDELEHRGFVYTEIDFL